MDKQQGFSLIELLIVITVIAIIAAIAVPNLLKSRAAANEASAIASVRIITTAQITFAATSGGGSYAAGLTELVSEDLIDSALGGGSKDGYLFTTVGSDTSFTVNADPITEGRTGTRHFFSDETGVIRYSASGQAGSASPVLGSTTQP
jgi:prepilin-type N-terminal cleavage/methylation domain-containing protein